MVGFKGETFRKLAFAERRVPVPGGQAMPRLRPAWGDRAKASLVCERHRDLHGCIQLRVAASKGIDASIWDSRKSIRGRSE